MTPCPPQPIPTRVPPKPWNSQVWPSDGWRQTYPSAGRLFLQILRAASSWPWTSAHTHHQRVQGEPEFQSACSHLLLALCPLPSASSCLFLLRPRLSTQVGGSAGVTFQTPPLGRSFGNRPGHLSGSVPQGDAAPL